MKVNVRFVLGTGKGMSSLRMLLAIVSAIVPFLYGLGNFNVISIESGHSARV